MWFIASFVCIVPKMAAAWKKENVGKSAQIYTVFPGYGCPKYG
jgi:hypothetical protein